MSECDKWDDLAEMLLPCLDDCQFGKAQGLHHIRCPYKRRPAVAAELRKLGNQLCELENFVALTAANCRVPHDCDFTAEETLNRIAEFYNEQAERIERLEGLLKRLRAWDHLDGAGDGPYWKREIDAALESFPEQSELPTPTEMRGIAKGMTEGQLSEDYLRKIREGE